MEWDVTLNYVGTEKSPIMRVHIPAAVTRALAERGMNRAILTLTDDGILVRPYVAPERERQRRGQYIPEDWLN